MADPKSMYMREIYALGLGGGRPTTTEYGALEAAARGVVTAEAYGYVAGSASSESTYRANRAALDAWQIVPSMLRGVELAAFDASVSLFGRTLPTPLIVAPIGVQSQLHPLADTATASAAAALDIPFTLSSATSTPLESVTQNAPLPPAHAWFQLYWPLDDDITTSLLRRAKLAGYSTLVVTLDTWTLGWRPRDLDAAYNPFLKGQGVANLFSDPVFVEKYCDGKSPMREGITDDEITEASMAAVAQLSPGISRSWDQLAFLREQWGTGPIVLKGIQSVPDAARAVQAGMDGVWVSNHGGRQVDGAVGSLRQLPAIASYLRSLPKHTRPAIIFDSGIRTGADVMKALCLGADAVAIGRPWAWGLAVDGQDGVEHVLKSILADFEINAALAGFRSTAELGPHALVRADSNL